MPQLYVTSLLPNPMGKDRQPYGLPPTTQLNNEWVEFINATQYTIDLSGVRLNHATFNPWCQQTGADLLMGFTGELNPGYSVRVHTGSGEPHWNGLVRYLYAGRINYVWNNNCGDVASLWNSSGTVMDWASYSPQPPEGRILTRQPGTNNLI